MIDYCMVAGSNHTRNDVGQVDENVLCAIAAPFIGASCPLGAYVASENALLRPAIAVCKAVHFG